MTDPLGERPSRTEGSARPSKKLKPSSVAKVHGKPSRDTSAGQHNPYLRSRQGRDDSDVGLQTSPPQQEPTGFWKGFPITAPKTTSSKAFGSPVPESDAGTKDAKESGLNRKARTPPPISPPSLKRWRSGDVSNSSYDDDQGLHHSAASRSKNTLLQRHRDSTLSSADRRVGHGLLQPEHGLGLSSSRLGHGIGQEDDSNSVAGSSASSARSSKCSICLKSSEKQYDRLKKCSLCHRLYHEACRRPSLIEGTDPELWICFKCEPRRKPAQRPPLGPSNRPSQALNRSDARKKFSYGDPAIPSPLVVKEGRSSLPPDEKSRSLQSLDALFTRVEANSLREAMSEEYPIRPPLKVTIPYENSNDQQITKGSSHLVHRSNSRLDVLDKHDVNSSIPTQATYDSASKKSKGRSNALARDASTSDQLDEDGLDKLIFDVSASATAMREHEVSGASTVQSRQNLISYTIVQGPDRVPTGRSPASLSRNISVDQRPSPIGDQSGTTTGRWCSSCQKTRIWARQGEKVICRGCKSRRASIQNDETVTTIPETPQSMPVSPVQSNSRPGTASSQNPSATTPSAIFFKAAVLGSKAKIRSKELPATAVRTSLNRSLSPANKQLPPIGEEYVAQGQEQLAQVLGGDRPPILLDFDGDTSVADAYCPSAADTVGDEQPAQGSQDSLFDGTPPDYADVGSPPQDTLDPEPEAKLGLANSPGADATMSRRKSAPNFRRTSQRRPLTLSSRIGKSKRAFSCRELFALALLASDGVPQSSKQVKAWISETFPERYRMEDTGWQNSISAIPYNPDFKDDLRKQRRTSHKAYHWDFATSEIRNEWAARFPEFDSQRHILSAQPPAKATPSASSAVASPQQVKVKKRGSAWPGARSTTGDTPNVRKESNSDRPALATSPGEDRPSTSDAESQPNPKPRDDLQLVQQSLSRLQGLVQQESSFDELRQATHFLMDCIEAAERKTSQQERLASPDEIFMPFESKRPLQMKPGSGVRYNSRFLLAYPEYIMPSIDFMTQAQIEEKKEEIQKRPSRKATFGKRLAFARSQRDNVHDGMSGSFQARYAALKAEESRQKNVDQDQDHNQDVREADDVQDELRKAFNIPKDPVPALREGKLIFRSRSAAANDRSQPTSAQQEARALQEGDDMLIDTTYNNGESSAVNNNRGASSRRPIVAETISRLDTWNRDTSDDQERLDRELALQLQREGVDTLVDTTYNNGESSAKSDKHGSSSRSRSVSQKKCMSKVDADQVLMTNLRADWAGEASVFEDLKPNAERIASVLPESTTLMRYYALLLAKGDYVCTLTILKDRRVQESFKNFYQVCESITLEPHCNLATNLVLRDEVARIFEDCCPAGFQRLSDHHLFKK
ncbi:hypothetical protein BDV96DRAFT_570644 [Lophiotrema nucula]|uniref:PHD-type domain-containing protein n=1 Tax=Lophiotrema nucula TaxID=690887 RepID=A0A6A5ZDX1_9PLEO|nr:hypothetical protein BDV96DRAFT_570644 [Lophiotrema nucula]